MGRLHQVTDACLPQESAQGVLDEAVTKMEPCGRSLSGAKERVVPEDIHGVLATGTGSLLMKHLHAEAVSEQRAVV